MKDFHIQEHHKIHRFIGKSYEHILEHFHIYNKTQGGEYTIVTQRLPIGDDSSKHISYHRLGMRSFDNTTTNKKKRQIIQEINEWFQHKNIKLIEIP